jgi:hypothetical protein
VWIVRERVALLLILWLGLFGQAAAQPAGFAVASRSGVVEALELDASSMIVSGYRYHVDLDTRVEIGGSYGAYTMLEPGMRIRFEYFVISPSERRMVLIQELPANVVLDEY